RHATRPDPFGDEDAAVMAETGVVRMDELSGLPLVLVAADRPAILTGDARHVVAEMCHYLVLRIEKRKPRVQFGNDEQVLPCLGIGGQTVPFQRLNVLAINSEVLQGIVRPVADDNRRGAPRAAIDPDTVRRIEFTLAAAGSAECRQPLAVFVVAMDVERAVA